MLLRPFYFLIFPFTKYNHCQGCHGCDHMVFGFATTCTYAISAYEFESHSDEVYSIQHYVIRFVSDLRQVSGFPLVLWFPPPYN